MISRVIKILICMSLPTVCGAANSLDLTGEWRFALDPEKQFAEIEASEWRFPDVIRLPGMVTAQGFGEEPSMETEWTGDTWRHPEMFTEFQDPDNFKFPFFLQPPLYYVGAAWYQREVEIPADWRGDDVWLHLERPHWHTTVWINGEKRGGGEALGTPHDINLGSLPAGRHTLTLRIDNTLDIVNPGPSAHSVTDHTQGNWNGTVGALELRRRPVNRIDDLQVFPRNSGKVRVWIDGYAAGEGTVTVRIAHRETPGKVVGRGSVAVNGSGGKFTREILVHMEEEPKLWDEFDPQLYEISAALEIDGAVNETLTSRFGFREVDSRDGQLYINDRPLYLRGTLECAVFPLTGHPPLDVESWKRIIRICQDFGLNHIRFHSWCPPEAAFIAADELGFYFQVEASTWANDGALLGSGQPLDEWVRRETERMVRYYGNYPSFLLYAHGNEPHGPNHADWLQDFVAEWRERDERRLYTTGAGWTVRPGSDFHSIAGPRLHRWGEGMNSRMNRLPPSTDFDWSHHVLNHSDAPIVSHEIGQWCAYPNFEEIEKYTGFFQPNNLKIFRTYAERHELLSQTRDFLRASGKLQVLAYKHDIEAALRTENFGGFQLLNLNDFPGQGTALVGVVDAFWDEKGYVTAEEFYRFSGPVVPLARMEQMIFTTDDIVRAELQLSHFGPDRFENLEITWELAAGETIVAQGVLPARDFEPFALYDLGSIEVSLRPDDFPAELAPAKLTLTVGAKGEDFSNYWEVFVYPAELETPETDVAVTADLEEALGHLEKGASVLWLPSSSRIANDPERPLVQGFSPIFWNTAYTNWQPPHTLGLLIDPQHPAFGDFPTDFHSNWQWWEIQKGAQPFILTEHPDLLPLVQMIDDWTTNRRIGLVFEAKVGDGRLIASSADLASELSERPAARQLRRSLLEYMNGDRFSPPVSLEEADLRKLLRPEPVVQRLGATIHAESEEPGFEAELVLDGNASTFWHTEFSDRRPELPHALSVSWPEAVTISGLILSQRQDGSLNGQVREIELLDAQGNSLVRAEVPAHALNHAIKLSDSIESSSLALRVINSHSGPYASLATLDLILGD